MNIQRILLVVLIATAFFFTAAPLTAHHSAAYAYDTSKKVETHGTITKVLLRNPHAWVFLDSTDEAGQKVEWQIEMGPWTGMVKQGWTQQLLAPGTVVKVAGAPSRAPGSHGMTSANFFKPDGSPLGPTRGASAE